MAGVWIRAITLVRVPDETGTMKTYQPGDWLQVGKHDARMLQAGGQAEIMPPLLRKAVLDLDGCGIVAWGPTDAVKATIMQNLPGLPVSKLTYAIPYARTLFWDPGVNIHFGLLPVGFSRLATGWEIAIPVGDYNILAESIGTDDARKHTREVVHDLRVPVYDTRLVFAQKCEAAQQVLTQWREECKSGDDERLCWLRAWYKVKPITCALPLTWTRK